MNLGEHNGLVISLSDKIMHITIVLYKFKVNVQLLHMCRGEPRDEVISTYLKITQYSSTVYIGIAMVENHI